MATEEQMERAAEAFWRPARAAEYLHEGDIKIYVSEMKSVRTILLAGYTVAGYWEGPDIKLLQLCVAGKPGKTYRAELTRLVYWIIWKSQRPVPGEMPGTGPPETILDLITVEYDKKTGRSWLIGETYDDRAEIKSTWCPDPFTIGKDGLHAAWMDGRQTWLELSAEPTAEYERIFRIPITAEELSEIPMVESKLENIQAMIDGIERDIRQLRAKERDFTSSNIEMARRLGKQYEYEELLRQRDEHMWRENPKLPARFDKSILVGATPEEIVQVEVHIGDDRNRPEHQSLSFSGTTYSRSVFTAEEGEQRARNSLEDGELWRDAVTNQQTTMGMEDWNEHVINMDGWDQVLGDVVQIGDDAYIVSRGGGQIDMSVKSDDLVELAIAKKDIQAIWRAWEKYHLKALSLPGVAGAASIMRTIFEKYPAFKPEQMLKFTDMAPIEPEVEEEPEVAETKMDMIQKQIDAIELDIRTLRAKERDFDGPSIKVAERLGKRKEYERLLKERDEAMWRGNPCPAIKRAA